MRTPALLALTACAGAPAQEALPDGALVDHADWSLVDADLDPFPSHRPDDDACLDGGWGEEDGALEVRTDACRYFLGATPSLTDVRAGDTVRLYAYHDTLTAPEPAEGHLAVALDGTVLWELTVPIPAQPTPYEAEVEAPADVPAGAPVVLHLHNHGANTWTLLDVEVIR